MAQEMLLAKGTDKLGQRQEGSAESPVSKACGTVPVDCLRACPIEAWCTQVKLTGKGFKNLSTKDPLTHLESNYLFLKTRY